MTTLRKIFLFSSTLGADALAKTEKAKDFDSTKKFLIHLTTPPEHGRPSQAKNYSARRRRKKKNPNQEQR